MKLEYTGTMKRYIKKGETLIEIFEDSSMYHNVIINAGVRL
jgi:hypothetical protein